MAINNMNNVVNALYNPFGSPIIPSARWINYTPNANVSNQGMMPINYTPSPDRPLTIQQRGIPPQANRMLPDMNMNIAKSISWENPSDWSSTLDEVQYLREIVPQLDAAKWNPFKIKQLSPKLLDIVSMKDAEIKERAMTAGSPGYSLSNPDNPDAQDWRLKWLRWFYPNENPREEIVKLYQQYRKTIPEKTYKKYEEELNKYNQGIWFVGTGVDQKDIIDRATSMVMNLPKIDLDSSKKIPTLTMKDKIWESTLDLSRVIWELSMWNTSDQLLQLLPWYIERVDNSLWRGAFAKAIQQVFDEATSKSFMRPSSKQVEFWKRNIATNTAIAAPDYVPFLSAIPSTRYMVPRQTQNTQE